LSESLTQTDNPLGSEIIAPIIKYLIRSIYIVPTFSLFPLKLIINNDYEYELTNKMRVNLHFFSSLSILVYKLIFGKKIVRL
jgi:hypothetical protein